MPAALESRWELDQLVIWAIAEARSQGPAATNDIEPIEEGTIPDCGRGDPPADRRLVEPLRVRSTRTRVR